LGKDKSGLICDGYTQRTKSGFVEQQNSFYVCRNISHYNSTIMNTIYDKILNYSSSASVYIPYILYVDTLFSSRANITGNITNIDDTQSFYQQFDPNRTYFKSNYQTSVEITYPQNYLFWESANNRSVYCDKNNTCFQFGIYVQGISIYKPNMPFTTSPTSSNQPITTTRSSTKSTMSTYINTITLNPDDDPIDKDSTPLFTPFNIMIICAAVVAAILVVVVIFICRKRSQNQSQLNNYERASLDIEISTTEEEFDLLKESQQNPILTQQNPSTNNPPFQTQYESAKS